MVSLYKDIYEVRNNSTNEFLKVLVGSLSYEHAKNMEITSDR